MKSARFVKRFIGSGMLTSVIIDTVPVLDLLQFPARGPKLKRLPSIRGPRDKKKLFTSPEEHQSFHNNRLVITGEVRGHEEWSESK